jgi:hypothetical protein
MGDADVGERIGDLGHDAQILERSQGTSLEFLGLRGDISLHPIVLCLMAADLQAVGRGR